MVVAVLTQYCSVVVCWESAIKLCPAVPCRAVLCCCHAVEQRKDCKDWVALYSTSTWELQARTLVRMPGPPPACNRQPVALCGLILVLLLSHPPRCVGTRACVMAERSQHG